MIHDSRTAADVLECDAALYALHGQVSADDLDRDIVRDLETLGQVIRLDHGRAAMLTPDGLARIALLRVCESLPAGVLTVTHTGTGASLHYWPRGYGVPRADGGGRILAGRYRHALGVLDHCPPFTPVGHSGRAGVTGLAMAHRFTADRAAVLESDARAAYRSPWRD